MGKIPYVVIGERENDGCVNVTISTGTASEFLLDMFNYREICREGTVTGRFDVNAPECVDLFADFHDKKMSEVQGELEGALSKIKGEETC